MSWQKMPWPSQLPQQLKKELFNLLYDILSKLNLQDVDECEFDYVNCSDDITLDQLVEKYKNSSKLQEILIPSSINQIGRNSFHGCTNLKDVTFENLKLSKVAGGYIYDAGFMNLAFGVFTANTVSYKNCVFVNGA